MGHQASLATEESISSFNISKKLTFSSFFPYRKITLYNVVKRDIGTFVKEAQQKIEEEVSLPPGYFFTFGGQFESQQRAMEHLTTLMLRLIAVPVLYETLDKLGKEKWIEKT